MIPPQPHIAALRAHTTQLCALSKQIIAGTHIRARDHFGTMALLFLHAQLDHAIAACCLGDQPDTRLIARSMIEGMGQLLWARLPSPAGQPARALLWRTYEWMELWEELQAQPRSFTPTARARIRYHVRRYGAWYPEKRTPPRRGRLRREWHNTNLRQMFAEIDRDLHQRGELPIGIPAGVTYYDRLYAPYSKWNHWSPGMLRSKVVEGDDRSATYHSSAPTETVTALFAVFVCLLVTAHCADQHFQRGKAAELLAVNASYNAWRQAAAVEPPKEP